VSQEDERLGKQEQHVNQDDEEEDSLENVEKSACSPLNNARRPALRGGKKRRE